MTIKALYELFQSAVDQMSYDVDYGNGSVTQMELKFTEDDFRLPFLWVFPPTSANTQYTNSIASGTSWSMAGFVAVEDDIDASDEDRMNAQIMAEKVMADFVGKLRVIKTDDNNYFNDVSYNLEAEFRNSNGVYSGYGFNITANSDNLYDFCC